MSSPNTASYDRTLFRAWPFLAFVLPAMICWGFGDLEYYFLIALSWIIIPVAGLLSLIPYFIARKRGWRKVPGASLGPLILNWWSAIIIACTIPGKLTGGGRSSVLELITLDSMSRAWNNRILTVTLIIGAASWLLLVVTTAMAGTATPTSRLQSRIGSVVAITAPCLAVIAAFLVDRSRTPVTMAPVNTPNPRSHARSMSSSTCSQNAKK